MEYVTVFYRGALSGKFKALGHYSDNGLLKELCFKH